MNHRSAFLLFILSLLFTHGCDSGDHPTQTYLQRDAPMRHSDTLVQVLVRMIDRIEDLPLTGDRDVDRSRELIAHHEATLEMNAVLIRETTNEELRSYARELSTSHQEEIAQLQAFIEWHPEVPSSGIRGTPDLMLDLGELEPTDDLDAAYRTLMPMHLQDGIDLATDARDRGSHKEMRSLATDVINNAEKNLLVLKALK